MGNRSYLGTPMGHFEANNNIPPGWFFIFTKEDFRVGYARDDHPEGDRWTWPEAKEDGEEGTSIACSTTVRKALETMDRKSGAVRSPYIRGLLPGLDTLKGYLERSPPDGKVQLDVDQYTWFYRTLMEASGAIFKRLEMLDSSLEKDDPAGFIAYFNEAAGFDLTGDLAADKARLEADNSKLDDWFLGAAWPAKKEKPDEEE